MSSIVRRLRARILTIRCPYCGEGLAINCDRARAEYSWASDVTNGREFDVRCPGCSSSLWQYSSIRDGVEDTFEDECITSHLRDDHVGLARSIASGILDIGDCVVPPLEVAPDHDLMTDLIRKSCIATRIALIRVRGSGHKRSLRALSEPGGLRRFLHGEGRGVLLRLGDGQEMEFWSCMVSIISEREMTDWLAKYCQFDPSFRKHVGGQ